MLPIRHVPWRVRRPVPFCTPCSPHRCRPGSLPSRDSFRWSSTNPPIPSTSNSRLPRPARSSFLFTGTAALPHCCSLLSIAASRLLLLRRRCFSSQTATGDGSAHSPTAVLSVLILAALPRLIGLLLRHRRDLCPFRGIPFPLRGVACWCYCARPPSLALRYVFTHRVFCGKNRLRSASLGRGCCSCLALTLKCSSLLSPSATCSVGLSPASVPPTGV